MADMREALRKAGLVSEKQARQAKHKQRVHRKSVGHKGLDEERRQKEAEHAEEASAKRDRDRKLEQERIDQARDVEGKVDPKSLVTQGIIRGAMGGPKQYFFTLPGGQITFLELSDSGFKRLIDGSAAIVESHGASRQAYCVVDPSAAETLEQESPGSVLEKRSPDSFEGDRRGRPGRPGPR